MSLIVITASIHGIRTGEWHGTGKTPLRIQLTGVALLIFAVIVLQVAGQMGPAIGRFCLCGEMFLPLCVVSSLWWNGFAFTVEGFAVV